MTFFGRFHILYRRLAVVPVMLILPVCLLFGQNHDTPVFPELTHIILDYDSVLRRPEIDRLSHEGRGLTIGHRVNNITFVVNSIPGYQINYFLKGYDVSPSFQGEDHIKDYTNLPPGSYALILNFITDSGDSGTGEIVSFRVLPPWYRSGVAKVTYPLLLVLLLWYLYEQMNYRFARLRYRLEQIINVRTEDLIREKEKSEDRKSVV